MLNIEAAMSDASNRIISFTSDYAIRNFWQLAPIQEAFSTC